MALFKMDLRIIIPILSLIMITTLGFKYILSFNNKHKNRDRPIIYYELAAIYSPAIISGTLIGVYFL